MREVTNEGRTILFLMKKTCLPCGYLINRTYKPWYKIFGRVGCSLNAHSVKSLPRKNRERVSSLYRLASFG